MAEERKAFLLRLDPALYREIERWAQEELRSVNGQIEWALRQVLARRAGGRTESDRPGPPSPPPSSLS